MDKGDVLIASTTTPDWMYAIKLAGAIVTDEGGIISHAAIVSRELGIPCIIGTKSATTNIKDGDIVTIDTETGTITW
jgi:pyruvate,water dikinase